jgi:hypothetical protein
MPPLPFPIGGKAVSVSLFLRDEETRSVKADISLQHSSNILAFAIAYPIQAKRGIFDE